MSVQFCEKCHSCLEPWSCLMSICPLGGIKVTVSGANVCCQHGVVLNVELLFGAHVSWIVFSAFYFPGRQSCCLSLATVSPHSKWASAFGTEGQEDAAEGLWVRQCGAHYTWVGNKEIWKHKAGRCWKRGIWRKAEGKELVGRKKRGDSHLN